MLFQDYQDETVLLSVKSADELSKTETKLFGQALMEEYSEFWLISKKHCSITAQIELESDGLEMWLASDETACIPEGSNLLVSGKLMTHRDRQKTISQIWKFETISTQVFLLALLSCHFELGRVQASLIECQQGSTRTYGSRLSVLSATLALLWIQGLTTFYLTLALVYGNFTWYFLWPTLTLSVMSCLYLQ